MIIHLQLRTWIGLSPGASHYYAELKPGDGEPVSLGYKLSEAQAAAVNKAARESWFKSFQYHPGDWYEGFSSKSHAIEIAKSVWRKHFPNGTFLLLGYTVNVEPKPILDGTVENLDDLKNEASRIIEACEKLGWYDNSKVMDQYYLKWAALVGAPTYGIEIDEGIL